MDINKAMVLRVSEALIFGAWMLAQALSYAPNVNVAILSAARLLGMLDREPVHGASDKEPLTVAPIVSVFFHIHTIVQCLSIP